MAELDLLRHIEVLSTVSGGSIIGALYILLLKKKMSENADLVRQQYIDLVNELDQALVRAIKKNLRTRLFMNPLKILWIAFSHHTLGKRMTQLYERHLYREVVRNLEIDSKKRWWKSGRILLKNIRPIPKGGKLENGIEAYNAAAVKDKKSAVTNIIINATSLNSGARFWFSSAEIGDWYLGHFRYSELEILKSRKSLMELEIEKLKEKVNEAKSQPPIQQNEKYNDDDIDRRITSPRVDMETSWLAHWLRTKDKLQPPAAWNFLFEDGVPLDVLDNAEFGKLRKVKVHAWYYRIGHSRKLKVEGGLSKEEHLEKFWYSLNEIDKELKETLKNIVGKDGSKIDGLMDFILELYWLRTAKIMSWRIEEDLDNLTLGDAVGASASFPPVFPPYTMLGIYDDLHVSRLGLTDGGVFDNIGVKALLDESCTHIIASDTSGLFHKQESVSVGRPHLLLRIFNIISDRVAVIQRDEAVKNNKISGLKCKDSNHDEMRRNPFHTFFPSRYILS